MDLTAPCLVRPGTISAMNMNLDNLNRKYVARTPHMLEIGARVTAVEPARGSMSLPARPEWAGDPVRGLLHPGVLTVLADSACGLAVGAALTERAPYATLEGAATAMAAGDVATIWENDTANLPGNFLAGYRTSGDIYSKIAIFSRDEHKQFHMRLL